ncbi:MAG: RCC1 domain-containing protein [Actinomycetota bacterium]
MVGFYRDGVLCRIWSWVYDEDLGVELTYRDGKWKMDEDPAGDTSPTLTYELGGEAVFRLDLQARLDLLLWDKAGPFLKVGPFFEFVAQTDDPWWYVDAGITATVGGSVKLWGWEAEVAFGPFELARWRLAEAAPGLQPGPGYVAPSKLQSFDVSVSSSHLCVITARHEVACQGGDNEFGWLGTGDTDPRAALTPIAPPLVSGEPLAAVQVEAGNDITCARYEDGSVRCWGANWHGAASPTPGEVLSPNLIDLPAPAIEIFQPWTRQACALLETFELVCWGEVFESDYLDPDQFPEVWARDTSDFNPPYVVELSQVVDADIGAFHVCGLLSDGTLECQGDFSAGGIPGSVWIEGEVLDRVVMTPQPMEGVTDVVEIDNGCGVRRDGTVTCWAFQHDDDPFAGVDDAVAVAAGRVGTTRCVLHTTGGVSCIATNPRFTAPGFGVPGADRDMLTPIDGWGSADPDADVIRAFDVSAGGGQACAQTGGNRTFCWSAFVEPEMLDAIVR